MKYEALSKKSLFLMRFADLIFRGGNRKKVTDIKGDIVISSIGGLGDLMIQLPLLDALYRHYIDAGNRVKVVLRPNHTGVAELMGWEYMAFESPATIRVRCGTGAALKELFRRLFGKKSERVDWWIDLTGNVMNNLIIRGCYTRNLVASGLRGGGGVTSVRLPDDFYWNMDYRMDEWRKFFGLSYCDAEVLKKRFSPEELKTGDEILLVVSTPCRWRNWPLDHFIEVVKHFPECKFAVSGFRGELPAEDLAKLDELLKFANVTSLLDGLPLRELILRVARSRMVITPDTSIAHIANRFERPGVVIFGPVDSAKWHSFSGRLTLLKEHDCPLFPCVQWQCGFEDNWCMRRITPDRVITAMRDIMEREMAQ